MTPARTVVLATALLAAGLVTLTACSDTGEVAAPAETVTVTQTVEADPSDPPAPTDSATPISPTGAPTDDGEVDLSQPPTTYAEAVAHLEAASGPGELLDRFATADGNLYCVIESEFVPSSCELGTGAIPSPDLCPDGPSQNVGRIEFGRAGPEPICNSDTIREPDAPTLAPGSIALSGGTAITCVVEEIGVTCLDPMTDQGFFLAEGRYEIF